MTTRPASADAQILALLTQVCDICARRSIGNRHDVARVAALHLPRSNPRAEAAEREVRALRARLQALTHDGKRVVELPRRQAEAITAAAEGRPQQEIAAMRGVCASNVSALLQRAAHNIGADDLPTAIVLVRSGAVTIKPRDVRRSRAA